VATDSQVSAGELFVDHDDPEFVEISIVLPVTIQFNPSADVAIPSEGAKDVPTGDQLTPEFVEV